jgi:hypothetical protein
MLKWAAGPRPTDGIWGEYWYASVNKSTGFKPYQPDNTPVPEHLQEMVEECNEIYEELAQLRITA